MTTTTRKHHGRVIDTDVRIDATPLRVWEAWANPEHIANWFVDRAEGVAAPGEVMKWFFDSFNLELPVPIIEAKPGKTFVTGGGDAPGPHGLPYLMEITITKQAGTTTMRLVNSGFSPDAKFDDEYDGVVSGWKCALATLKHWLERYPDLRRTHRIVIQPASYSWEQLWPWFHTADGRCQWLDPLVPSDSRVLVDSGREVLLEWPGENAMLGLKAFGMGPQRMLALDLSRWSKNPRALDDVTAQLNDGLARLSRFLG